jgi:TolA-binding protein
VAVRTRTHVTLFGLLNLLLGWFVGSLSNLHGQELEDLRETFLRERPLWYQSADTAGPGNLIAPLENSSWGHWLLLRQGERDLEIGNYELADHAMNELIASDPPTFLAAKALLNRGTVALERKEYGRARFYFNEAIAQAMVRPDWEGETIAGLAFYSIGLAHAIERDQPVEKTVGILEEFLEHYPGNPKRRDAIFLLGELAEMRGDCEGAIEYYDKIFDNFPIADNLDALNHKAYCLAQLGRHREAQEMLDDVNRNLFQGIYAADSLAVQRERIAIEGRLLRGEIEMVMENYAAAESAFLPILSDPASPYRRRGILGLAATYQAAHRNDSALALYDRLLVEDTVDAVTMRAQFNKALLLASTGRNAEADSLLRAIAGNEQHIMSDRALVELGIGAYRRRDFTAASDALTRGVTLARNDGLRARAYTILGAVYLGEGDAAKAIDAFAAADKLVPAAGAGQDDEVPEARLLRGITLARVNRSAEAITVLNRFIEGYSNHAGIDQALYWLGESYYQASLYKAAVDVTGALVEHHPGSPLVPDALYTMGWAQLKQKNFSKAEGVFAQLVKAFPLSTYTAEAQIRRGDALYLAGEYDAAIDAYRQADRLNPSAEEAAYADYQRALANYQLGDLSEADTLFQSFATCYTSSELANDATYLRGDIALRQGRYEQAIALMASFIARSNQEDLLPRAYVAIGDAQAKLGEEHLAEGAYSIVLGRFPASSYAKRAQEQMTAIASDRSESDGDATTGAECAQGLRIAIDRAEILRLAGRVADALREYRSIDPVRLDGICRQRLLLGIARGHVALGERAMALDTFRMAIDQFPGSPASHAAMIELSAVHAALGDTASALTLLDRLLAESGDSTAVGNRAILERAALYAHAGRIDTARPLLRRIAAHDPASPLATRAWILLARYDNDPAWRDSIRAGLAESARRDDSTGMAALLALADLHAGDSDNQQEVKVLHEVVRRFGGDRQLRSTATIRLGEAYERLGSTARAKEVYQELLRRDCNDAFKKQAQEHLDALGRL